ncbi:hypothetical protein UK23_14725 [Lentzea aerocolonigenes]|uniref:Uncharacterized protein n=1 Tax=Lentzea aerocolonigenes TaxID=68170 RepID=A0A0F0H2X6_LENAE|nr:hypothetical protein UK23_14725 [Lentzea aerocolonigenes]
MQPAIGLQPRSRPMRWSSPAVGLRDVRELIRRLAEVAEELCFGHPEVDLACGATQSHHGDRYDDGQQDEYRDYDEHGDLLVVVRSY